MPLGFGASRQAGRLEVEVAADTDDFDKAMDELPKKAMKAGDAAGAEVEQQTSKRMKLLKVWLGANALALVGSLAFAFRDKLNPVMLTALGRFSKLGILMNSKVRRAIGAVTRGVGKLYTSMLDWAEIGIRGAGAALKAFGNRLKHEGVILNGFGHAVTAVGHALEKFGRILGWVANIWTQFKLGTVLGVGIFVALTTKAASEFENRFARVRTLLKGVSENDLRILGTSARRMSNEIGISSREINDTLYQTLSALPQLANETKKAMEIVEVAGKVAATGFAEAEVAVRAVTGIMNAWKLEADSAIPIADALFAAQDQGVTTFGEMAQSIGEVSGLTAALGGDWRDLLAIVATNTPFISTSETITGIASALSGVLEQGAPARAEAERLGLDFSAAALKAKGLIPFLREVAELTEGDPEVIAKLFGRREAVQLVVNLAQNMETLNEKLEIVKNTTGTLEENLSIMNNTVERQGEIMKSRFSALLASMGLDFDRWKVKGMRAINEILGGMGQIIESNRQAFDETQKMAEEGTLPTGGSLFERFERALLRNPARQLTGFQIAIADAIEVGVQQADATAFAQMIIDAKGDIALAMTQVLDESVQIWRSQSRVYDEIFKPAEPTSVEFAQKKIADFTRTLKAAALFEFFDTGDVEAYNEAIEGVRERVNALLLAERNRLIAAGVEVKVANQLLDAYQMADFEAQKAAEARAKAATDALGRMLAMQEVAEQFGAVGFEEAPEALRPVISAINKVDGEILSIAKTLEEATAGTDEFNGALARLGALREHRRELEEMGAAYGDLLPVIEKFGTEIVDYVRDLPLDEQGEFLSLAMDTATILDTVTDAQIAYNLAVEEWGEDSEQAKDAQAVLTKAAEGARKVLLVLIGVFDGLGLATDELRKGLQTLSGVLAGLPGGGGGEQRGGLIGFLFGNAETIEGVARGLLSVADAIGDIGEDARRSLQGVIDLAAGIKGISDSLAAGQGLSIGGLSQSIGGAIGLISGIAGLFGESEEDRRRKEILKQNTNALRSLKESIDRQRELALGLSEQDRERMAILEDVFRPITEARGTFGLFAALTRAGTILNDLGLTFEDLQRWVKEMGVDITFLTDEGELLVSELERAMEALDEIDLEDIFGGIEGALDRLQIEMALFDIDEPIDQLKRYYEFLRDNTKLDVPQFDLDTVEGRAALDEWIRALFDGFTSLDPEQLGAMTPEQILQLIETMEGLTDTLDEGPDSQSFQEFRGITEVTANRLAGLLTTDVYWNEMTALNAREMVRLLGGTPIGPAGADDLVPNLPPDLRPPRDLPRDKGDVLVYDVKISTLEVNVTEAQNMDAAELAGAVTRHVSQNLGNELVRQQRSGGGMLTRTVR